MTSQRPSTTASLPPPATRLAHFEGTSLSVYDLATKSEWTIGGSRTADIRLRQPGIAAVHSVLHTAGWVEFDARSDSPPLRVATLDVPAGSRVAVLPNLVFAIGDARLHVFTPRTARSGRAPMSLAEWRALGQSTSATRRGALVAIHASRGLLAPAQHVALVALRSEDAVHFIDAQTALVLVSNIAEAQLDDVLRRVLPDLLQAGATADFAVTWLAPHDRFDEVEERAVRKVAATSTAPMPSDGPPSSTLPRIDGVAMGKLREVIERVAATSINVLLLGETGSGKEVLAGTLHRLSARRARPFTALNCAAMPEGLLEGELFGYERGAFTGAVTAKPGLLESAEGGTVFLDEIGDMPPATQAKLLRVLESREVMRLGGRKPIAIDVRFVAATHRDLRADVRAGRFRQDLYFRLNGISVQIPPLRERRDEIEGFARQFLRERCERDGIPVPDIDVRALGILLAHAWPGNIRELRNAMDRAATLAADGVIHEEHLPADVVRASTTLMPAGLALSPSRFASPSLRPPSVPRELSASGGRPSGSVARTSTTGGLRDEVAAIERERILEALDKCAGNQTRAAKMLGIGRGTLLKRLTEYGVPRPRK